MNGQGRSTGDASRRSEPGADGAARPVRVLMVCMGNICRSPTAEAVLRHQARAAGLDGRVVVDSAGTHASHEGQPPDTRAQAHASRRGYDLSALRARQVQPVDFTRFDLMLTMDWDNLALLEERAPADYRRRIRPLLSVVPGCDHPVVPDPWAGGAAEFERALDLIEAGCAAWIARWKTKWSDL